VAYGQGTDNALDDARWLITAALRLAPDTPDWLLSAQLLPSEREMLWNLVCARILERQPTAYLVGEAWLCGYRFRADARALIPRSYLAEFLTAEGFPGMAPSDAPLRILELCTGSASLSILAAQAWPEARLVATDLSAEALSLAAENLADYGLTHRARLYQGDLFSALPVGLLQEEGPFDLIVCNPPYVNQASMAGLPAEFCHEPTLALAGGLDGMALVARILREYQQWLAPQGLLVVEIGHEGPACQKLFDENFPTLSPVWLDTAQTSQRVFLLGAIT
jgi:ribosomal protein L3 glutamine methyltransferase